MAFSRYVAIGDSFTEGVGDPDPTRPNGLRGWADRVAEVLATKDPDFGYANLAIRGRKLRAILAEQVEPALALEPDLVTVYAGANDIVRPKVDLDALATEYDAGVARLAASGARIVLFTAFDPGSGGIYAPIRGRFALYNEHVRAIADRHGATIADSWRVASRLPEGVTANDPRLWDVDRMHLGPAGHQLTAIMVLDTLGVPHDLQPLPLPDLPVLSRRERLRADAAWTRGYLAPWIQRRLTGRSSGDSIEPRFPAIGRVVSPGGE
ncbi:SGNH/GDSL hydrolase family protein [Nocardioides sp. zg-579]|uniref:SGNH/GDSL hydrolase family protein n=1 Tax=Nocardioides marmotae TaxID=2663857 RepID=A0A6I3JFA0_9ACTN|nr:SGNH/GDSL hydrolase family protein [Nocardioides marmotae]MCR6033145.1 SGNH/GDSL hydrolase family protein [Gordonia jinghuaiqii]MTB96797.1 SGNH/GDSL hydrolase family protein [Nocardioides marmotae]QKE02999.1 SGNH/GDSL hydrolase family protein [Nocardioides marmotae]